ncbi:MAG: serine/threonine protein kinase, partial [Lentisphaerae bacterium]|nr:serine/threonine protein kinase [Lentisphaerota bacterium]
MAESILYCAGCNVKFRAKQYDPKKAYKCPKCNQPLEAQGEGKGGGGEVSLDTKGGPKRDAAPDPLVGRKIGQYKIVKKLGQGGMGAVYQAEHLALGRAVALKILPPKMAEEEPDAVERFKREARSAAVLEHPNVVTTYAVGSEGKHHFIELQLVHGGSLQDRLQREGKLPVAEATRIVLDAARALEAAHAQNIVHRDIKPANIMLTREGQVKVMDFGLAKDVTAPSQLTVSGHIMGTPYYMSPEQCQAKKLDGRSDVYSLGATYYHLLTGSFPYSGDSLFDIMYQHKEGPIPQVQEKRPDAPASVQPIIERAMAKKPEDRFQTMEEFAAALSNVAQPPSAVSGAPPFAVRR